MLTLIPAQQIKKAKRSKVEPKTYVFHIPSTCIHVTSPNPVSCFALRFAASKKVSPLSIRPPGHHQSPFAGSDDRFTNKHSFLLSEFVRTKTISTQKTTQSLTSFPYRSEGRNFLESVMVVNSSTSP